MAVRPDDEQSMPLDLRAVFAVRLYRRAQTPPELADPEARLKNGVWWITDVDIDGTPHTIVFSAR